MKYQCPPIFRFYCRTCEESTWHSAGGTHIACIVCKRTVSAAEVVATYSTDEYERPPVLLLPLHALPEFVLQRMLQPEAPEEPEDAPPLRAKDRALLSTAP